MDLSGITGIDVSPDTIRELAFSPPVMPNPEAPRFVIAAMPKAFGLARMFELEGQHTRPNLHVVRTLDDACAILGISNFHFEPIEA